MRLLFSCFIQKFSITLIAFLCIMSLLFLLANCGTQKKAEYNIGSDVTEENKKLFIERAEKGNILFKIHCAGCHGIYSKGKDGVPNFTKHQIDNYHARSIIAFQGHSSVRNLSSEQLDYVLTFLRLRKPNE